MRTKIRNCLKSFNWLYTLYFYSFSFLLRFLGLFIKTDNKLVLFVCYSGRRYDDSPRFLYEYMKQTEKYKTYKCLWAFEDPKDFPIPKEEKIKIDSIAYYKAALKAKYWITNSSITRGLKFKKKKTKYVIFQHGTVGIKKLGTDIEKDNTSFRIKKEEKIDMFIIQGKKEQEILERCLGLKGSIYKLGLPRNDELASLTKIKIENCRKKLGIPKDKKVLLYAPTFREFYKDKNLDTYVRSPFDFKKMEEELKDEYVLLLTAHYEVANMLNIPKDSEFVINAFKYPYMNDLLLVADILISDYSSVFFDYAILERPMLCFAYDYDLYKKERGFYTDLNKLFYDGVIKSQKKLISVIQNMDYNKQCAHTKKIKEEYIEYYGNTVKTCAEYIFDEENEK